ncbi:MAG: hypothetical protein GY769_07290 [bacterium]|nr:hypothetical protein [bacterium]
MLNLYRHTGDRGWLRRAGDLAHQAAQERSRITEYPYSLYKGELALAVLAADLERPEDSAQPFFEVEGWRNSEPGKSSR